MHTDILKLKNKVKKIKKNIRTVKKMPKLKNTKKILHPGEDKSNKYFLNSKKKLDIPLEILKEINKLLAK